MVTDLMPNKSLAPYISKYSFINLSSPYNNPERCIPDGSVKLFIYESNSYIRYRTDTGKVLQWKDGVGGHPLSATYSMEIPHPIRVAICYFKASAFYRLFKIPIRLLNDDIVALEEVLEQHTFPLKDQLANTIDIRRKKLVLDQFFIQLLCQTRLSHLNGIETIEQNILQRGGNIRLDTLIRATNLSFRSVERLFGDYVGLSPKQFCKVIRFNRAFLLRKNNPEISWQEIMYHCGYYDQSHYINEFRSFTGAPPKEFSKNSQRISSFYVGNYIDNIFD